MMSFALVSNPLLVEFVAKLNAEWAELAKLKPVLVAIGISLALGFAVLVGVIGPLLVRLAWRLGRDHHRRLGLASSAMRLLGLLIGIGGVLKPVVKHAPILASLIVLALIVFTLLIAPTQLRNFISGLGLSTRSRLREGDLVTIGGFEGTVRDIGLLRVGLRTADGGVTHIPAADFDRMPVTVGSRHAAVPVEAVVQVGPEFDERELEGLRRALWLSVYRRAGTDLVVDFEPNTRRLQVRMDTWASMAVAEVEAHVRALLLARTQRGGELEAAGEEVQA